MCPSSSSTFKPFSLSQSPISRERWQRLPSQTTIISQKKYPCAMAGAWSVSRAGIADLQRESHVLRQTMIETMMTPPTPKLPPLPPQGRGLGPLRTTATPRTSSSSSRRAPEDLPHAPPPLHFPLRSCARTAAAVTTTTGAAAAAAAATAGAKKSPYRPAGGSAGAAAVGRGGRGGS